MTEYPDPSDCHVQDSRCPKMRGSNSRIDGFILLPVILAITVIASISWLMNIDTGNALNLASAATEASKSDYTLQAALQHAQWQINQNGCGPHSDLPATNFGEHSYSATIATNGTGTTTSYTTPVDQDTWIEKNSPGKNYGSDAQLKVKVHPNHAYQAMYRFDVSDIPLAATVESATARFFVINPDTRGPIGIHAVTSDWTENGATWQNMASNFDPASVASIARNLPADQYADVDLTSLVQSWINGSANHGVMLIGERIDSISEYTSREYGDSSKRPTMEVVVTDGIIPTLATITTEVNMANGSHRSLVRTVNLYQQPFTSLLLQPDNTDSADTQILQSSSSSNYSAEVTLDVSPQSRALLQFSLATIPTMARIQSAELALYVESSTGGIANVTVSGVTSEWDVAAATWDNRTTANTWSAAGGDIDPEPEASFAVTTTGWNQWDVTQLVQSWSNRTTPLYGFALALETTGSATYSSSEGAIAENRPKLTINYSCRCGTVCVAPQGIGNILFVVGRDDALTEGETNVAAEFRRWGYVVTTLGSDATALQFDAAIETNDVIYASEYISSAAIGNKLDHAEIGIVYESPGLNDNFGIAATSTWTASDTKINIVDTTHDITSIFNSGSLRIRARPGWLRKVGGAVSNDVQTLATIDGIGALVTLDSGARRYNGGIAFNRRVMLPMSGYITNQFTHLTNDGRLMTNRSIQWAIQGEPPLLAFAEADTFLRADKPGINYGNDIKLKLSGENNKERQPVLRFTMPTTGPITSAILGLYVVDNKLKNAATVQVFALTEDWDEAAATWLNRTDAGVWADAGGTHSPIPAATVELPKTLKWDWFRMDITDLVQGWLDGSQTNYGLILISDDSKEVNFASSENPDPALQPQILITEP